MPSCSRRNCCGVLKRKRKRPKRTPPRWPRPTNHNQFMSDNPDGIIHISSDDVSSAHVDDMLKRQMSMRGDPGVSRDHNRAWYYQNWFVLAVVGMFGAIAAWGILEP